MIKKYFFYVLIITLSSCGNPNAGDFPYKNVKLPIHKVKLYRSYLFVNDTLSFTGSYFLKESDRNSDKKMLYGNLHVGDTLITDNNPAMYVTRKRDGIETTYYRWHLVKENY